MATAFTGFGFSQLSGVKVTDRVLGRGSYATILELEYMGLKCAGKKIHDILLAQGDVSHFLHNFQSECHLLSQLHHPNIVQFLGVFFEDRAPVPMLVMEYLPTDLTSFLQEYGILSQDASYSILYDVSLGLNYLHNRTPPIIHRDLSSNNVLLTSGLTAKISDLGVARILNLSPFQVSRMTQTPGTPAYMPPEVMIASPKYDTSIDVFSFGIMTIHMFCGEWPVPQEGQIRIEAGKLIPVSEAERREVFLQRLENDHPLMHLILQCISNSPQQRPSASEIVEHLAKVVQMFPNSSADRLATLSKSSMTRKQVLSVNPSGKENSEKEHVELKRFGDVKEKSKTKMLEPADLQQPHSPSRDAKENISQNLPIYVAKLDYSSSRVNGLSFKKGEQLYIVKVDGCWWFARSKVTGDEGYVPSYCMAKVNDLEAQE